MFNGLRKTLAETLEDFFKVLGGMLLLVVAFLGLMFLVSFSISPISTVLNEKYRGLLDVFISKEYLGETYLSIALSLGLLIFI